MAHLHFRNDFYTGGDLCNLLDKFERFKEEMVRAYAAQLVVALEAIHSLEYVHRDIRPENILLDVRFRVCSSSTS
jgi:serine/threonine protein kinase